MDFAELSSIGAVLLMVFIRIGGSALKLRHQKTLVSASKRVGSHPTDTLNPISEDVQ